MCRRAVGVIGKSQEGVAAGAIDAHESVDHAIVPDDHIGVLSVATG